MHGTVVTDRQNNRIEEIHKLANHPEFQAELRYGFDPEWSVWQVIPGQERIAAAHLVARRFGVYVPEIAHAPKWDRGKLIAGAKLPVMESMYPGFIFIWTWDIEFHKIRIRGCPGMMEMLVDGEGNPPAITDEMIEEIKEIENILQPLRISVELLGKPKKRWRKSRTSQEEAIHDNEIISVHTWSAFTDGIEALDALGRNQILRRALGLAS